MSINRVTRSEKLLQKLVDGDKLSAKGKDWLIVALDPFHDTQVSNLGGWPDMSDQPSVVRCFKKSITVTRDSNAPQGNWDCVINTLPILNSRMVANVPERINNAFWLDDWTTPQEIGPISIDQYASGGNWGLYSTSDNSSVISLPENILRGEGRLIGMGFEVVNTTAEIYKQGTAYVYRYPQQDALEVWMGYKKNGGFVTSAPLSQATRQVAWGPKTESEIMLLSGSRTWEAAKGAYVVTPFRSQNNPIVNYSYQNIALLDRLDGLMEPSVAGNSYLCMGEIHAVPLSSDSVYYNTHNHFTNTHSTGAAFVGLSPETTLTVSAVFYYEQFPSADETEIVTLAKPSAAFDPLALELYSYALADMPVGVPASMNGLGDWFAGIVSKLAPIMSPLLTPLLGPAAIPLGIGAKTIADTYMTTMGNDQVPKKLHKQNNTKKLKKPQINTLNNGQAKTNNKNPKNKASNRLKTSKK